jgi:hypothetical protein
LGHVMRLAVHEHVDVMSDQRRIFPITPFELEKKAEDGGG